MMIMIINISNKIRNLIMKINNLYYKLKFSFLGVTYGKNLWVDGKIIIKGDPRNIFLKNNVRLGEGLIINSRDKIVIGNDVHISCNSQLHTGYLKLEENISRKHFSKSITIEDNVWIASGVVISAGVKIGRNSVIGANSVVTKNIESNSFYAGIPAKKIKNLNFS